MRSTIVPEGVKHLEYEIRQIVDYGHQLQNRFGVQMTWENIGDPIACGEAVEPWVREVVTELAAQEKSWAYSPSRGVLRTREFLAAEANIRPGGVRLEPDDILFFNGVADAVDKIYDLIRKDSRVLMQSPCYSTHSSNEGKRGDYPPLQFSEDPRNGWRPDLEEVERHVRYNPQIIAIALVNPDNPTGAVYERADLEGIVDIARRYGLFLICDEIYAHITFNGAETLHFSQIVGDVPALALRGISKDYPWPGSRCGWIEMLNRDRDPDFRDYCEALVKAKMMEVCSTTLPQMSVPLVYGDPRYRALKHRRAAVFEARVNEAHDIFGAIGGVHASRPRGAFYFTVVFDPGALHDRQTLPIADPELARFVEASVKGVRPDKRFVTYLMASAGICVTPLSGFHTPLDGFRVTVLRADDAVRREVFGRLAEAARRYISS